MMTFPNGLPRESQWLVVRLDNYTISPNLMRRLAMVGNGCEMRTFGDSCIHYPDGNSRQSIASANLRSRAL